MVMPKTGQHVVMGVSPHSSLCRSALFGVGPGPVFVLDRVSAGHNYGVLENKTFFVASLLPPTPWVQRVTRMIPGYLVVRCIREGRR